MSNPAVIARELQDLASTVDRVAEALHSKKESIVVNVPEVASPAVVVNVPEALPPTVNVRIPEAAPPVVNVQVVPSSVEVASPTVNVLPQKPSAYEVTITERDRDGYIRKFVINPIG